MNLMNLNFVFLQNFLWVIYKGLGKNNQIDRILWILFLFFYRIFSVSVTKVQAKTITKTPPQCEPLTASQPHVAFIITKLKLFQKAEMATWALAFPM